VSEQGFARTLRELRERRGVTQGQVAQAMKVSRPTIAQWEAGRHLPSPERAVNLDEFLGADGALTRIVENERGTATATASTASAPGMSGTDLLAVFRDVEAALDRFLIRADDGRPLGWRHNMQRPDGPPTPVATAYGIRATLLLEEAKVAELRPLARQLRDRALPDGGWAASAQTRSRPEAIAAVVDAIARVDAASDVDQILQQLDATLDEIAWQRPFIMTTVLETVLDLQPASALASRLLRGLLDSRRPAVDGMRWSVKAEPGLVSPEPSALHTARAVSVLARARSMGAVAGDLAGEVDDALGNAAGWLLRQPDIDNTTENLRRTVEGRPEHLYLRHFTPAHVARALLLTGESVGHPVVVQALRRVGDHFDRENSVWRWSSGDLPVWMTFDAIAALRLAALASFRLR
jgi:transcriptional regulator with XRE-family HTH domain